jgi:hypothetical protein
MSDHADDETGLLHTPLMRSELSASSSLEVDLLLSDMSPSGRTTRTYSGSLLLSRGNRRNPLDERESWSTAAAEVICEGKGRKLAKAALSSGKSAAHRVFRGYRSPISCWLASLLAMVSFSIFFNGLEGTYFSRFFGDPASTSRTQEKTSFQPPPITPTTAGRPVVDSDNDNNDAERPLAVAPAKAPGPSQMMKSMVAEPIQLPASDFVSVHDHLKAAESPTTTYRHNSFSTWLDFDERDPLPSTTPVAPSDPKHFVEQWCILDKSVEWDPPGANDWHHRAPAFLLPGASHAGLHFLTEALHDHPSIVQTSTQQMNFFLDVPFNKFIRRSTTTTRSEKTLVKQARDAMYLRHYALTELKRNESLLAFDATPSYLYYSMQVPFRLLCVAPWVKLVVILRNPVDRVLEHYAAERQKGLKLSLEDWIDQDMELMKQVNLISTSSNNNNNNNNTNSTNIDEDMAWLSYQRKSVAGQIGRSMYFIPLRHWIKAFLRAGRKPDILLVRTDQIALDPNGQYQRILNFLGLAPMALQRETLPIEITHQIRPISNATRASLEAFFRPYNRKLKALIRRYNLGID